MVNKTPTKVALYMFLIRNPEITIDDLVKKGFNIQTIKKYMKRVKEAEKEYAGLK